MSKRTEYWRWEINSTTPPGRRIKTKHHMTEAEALERDPTAVRVPGTLEVRDLPETDAERLADTHTGKHLPKRVE
jgi:hypothetical protein